ncbi:uncharacterized protein LOC143005445 [Genypterus blacodes]|uniref:uncharacterized protein LOC143005445 n=1 Tax=Genypterus blacodes TaxID=154954 RepID=UPI003F75DB2A
MNITPNPAPVPDRDNLPLKKRDQRQSSPQQLADTATFKAPYPYKSHTEFRSKHTGPFQPVPRRVPALYQPWSQTNTPTRSKHHVISAFREHHGWAEWREFNPLHPGWDLSHYYHHFPGEHRENGPSGIHPGRPPHPSRFRPIKLISEGPHTAGGSKALRDESLNAEWQRNGRNKGPYMRSERRVESFPGNNKASSPLLSVCLRRSPAEDHMIQRELYKQQITKIVKHPTPGQSLHSSSEGSRANNTCTSSSSSSSSSSPNGFPWLLPHFAAGSLIELQDGRLRRVEDLQTEDFLLGSLARPDLRLSCCTVQSISQSASSTSISRLLILLHDQQSQELVDVYAEYPFFVRGRGWSSCCPQRTAGLCGLQCRLLSVGDVCLALTPVSATCPVPGPVTEPKTSPRKSDGRRGPPEPPHLPEPPDRLSGGRKREAEAARKRHSSAPELRGPGTNCA